MSEKPSFRLHNLTRLFSASLLALTLNSPQVNSPDLSISSPKNPTYSPRTLATISTINQSTYDNNSGNPITLRLTTLNQASGARVINSGTCNNLSATYATHLTEINCESITSNTLQIQIDQPVYANYSSSGCNLFEGAIFDSNTGTRLSNTATYSIVNPVLGYDNTDCTKDYNLKYYPLPTPAPTPTPTPTEAIPTATPTDFAPTATVTPPPEYTTTPIPTTSPLTPSVFIPTILSFR